MPSYIVALAICTCDLSVTAFCVLLPAMANSLGARRGDLTEMNLSGEDLKDETEVNNALFLRQLNDRIRCTLQFGDEAIYSTA